MLSRVALAAAAGVIVFLGCILVGMLLVASGFPIADVLGAFLTKYAVGLGFIAAVVHFFKGSLSL